jgi:hypothetical protein
MAINLSTEYRTSSFPRRRFSCMGRPELHGAYHLLIFQPYREYDGGDGPFV